MVFTTPAYVAVAMVFALGIFGQWSDGITTDLWHAPATALAMAFVYEGWRVRRRHLGLERELTDTAYLGRSVISMLRIRNPERREIQLDLLEAFPEDLGAPYRVRRVRVPPGGELRDEITVTPLRLGVYGWSKLSTRMLGPLGLAWWTQRHEIAAEFRVVPDHLSASEHRAGSAETGRYEKARVGASGDLLGLRNYAPGDPLSALDWKATARRGELMVKVKSTEEHVELLLAIDAGKTSGIHSGGLTRLHHYVNVAARLGEKALANGDRLGVVAFADVPIYQRAGLKGSRGLLELREVLAKLSTQDRESNPLAAMLALRRLTQPRSLVVLLSDLEDAESAGQLRRATSLLVPKHLPLIATVTDEDVLKARWRAAERWTEPYEMLAALELNKAHERSAAHLRRLGARVVLAQPEDLDRMVLSAYEQLRRERRL